MILLSRPVFGSRSGNYFKFNVVQTSAHCTAHQFSTLCFVPVRMVLMVTTLLCFLTALALSAEVSDTFPVLYDELKDEDPQLEYKIFVTDGIAELPRHNFFNSWAYYDSF
ncbi:hypothetical protein ACHWQZ_G011534 [Mnemiopsis leidyi]